MQYGLPGVLIGFSRDGSFDVAAHDSAGGDAAGASAAAEVNVATQANAAAQANNEETGDTVVETDGLDAYTVVAYDVRLNPSRAANLNGPIADEDLPDDENGGLPSGDNAGDGGDNGGEQPDNESDSEQPGGGGDSNESPDGEADDELPDADKPGTDEGLPGGNGGVDDGGTSTGEDADQPNNDSQPGGTAPDHGNEGGDVEGGTPNSSTSTGGSTDTLPHTGDASHLPAVIAAAGSAIAFLGAAIAWRFRRS